jgi:hypothetical protein
MNNVQIETKMNTTTENTKKTKPKGKKTSSKKEPEQTNSSPEVIVETPKEVILESPKEIIKEDNFEIVSCDEEELKNDVETASNNEVVLHTKEEIIQHFDNVINSLTFISNENLKDQDLSKDFLLAIANKIKKINTLSPKVTQNTIELLLKENLSSIKTKDLKNGKKLKKTINKENCAINKKITSYPEVIKFMELPEDTLISKGQIIQSISAFVKKEKSDSNPDIIVQGDNRSFKLIGSLKLLFDFIRKVMIERNDLTKDDPSPTQISYTQIMKYLKYCFPLNN